MHVSFPSLECRLHTHHPDVTDLHADHTIRQLEDENTRVGSAPISKKLGRVSRDADVGKSHRHIFQAFLRTWKCLQKAKTRLFEISPYRFFFFFACFQMRGKGPGGCNTASEIVIPSDQRKLVVSFMKFIYARFVDFFSSISI